MSIQRYDPKICPLHGGCSNYLDYRQDENGKVVLYADHAAEVARLTDERDAWKRKVGERETAIKCHWSVLRDVEAERDAAVARAEKAEKSATEEESACEKAMQERDELEDILSTIASHFGQEFSSSYGPESIQQDIIDLKENRDIWQSKVEGLEKKVRDAVARAERAEEAAMDLVSAVQREFPLQAIGTGPLALACVDVNQACRSGFAAAQDAKPATSPRLEAAEAVVLAVIKWGKISMDTDFHMVECDSGPLNKCGPCNCFIGMAQAYVRKYFDAAQTTTETASTEGDSHDRTPNG